MQSNYVPWKGYFDLITSVDEFILLDDAQYTRRDWRNRNRIKTAQGLRWLTIPVQVSGRYHQRIDETMIERPGVAKAHWDAPSTPTRRPRPSAIRRAARGRLPRAAVRAPERDQPPISWRLSASARHRARLTWSTDYGSDASSTDRLVELCAQAEADEYVSGPAARELPGRARASSGRASRCAG